MENKYEVLLWSYVDNEFETGFSATCLGEFKHLEDAEVLYNSIELDEFNVQKEIWLETEEEQKRVTYQYYGDIYV